MTRSYAEFTIDITLTFSFIRFVSYNTQYWYKIVRRVKVSGHQSEVSILTGFCTPQLGHIRGIFRSKEHRHSLSAPSSMIGSCGIFKSRRSPGIDDVRPVILGARGGRCALSPTRVLVRNGQRSTKAQGGPTLRFSPQRRVGGAAHVHASATRGADELCLTLLQCVFVPC